MISSPKAAAKALRLRNATTEMRDVGMEPSFVAQNRFVLDPARYLDAQCSRRAGKSNGLALRFFRTMKKHPKSQSVYLGLTRDSARDIMWPVLQEIDAKYRLGCEFTESNLTVTAPNKAKLKLYGADMSNFIKRLRGRKFPAIGLDEAQDFGVHLQSLVDDVLTPAIADYEDGWLAMTGTPGPVPQGYFFDVTHNRKYGYSHHEWTLLDNPYMPSVKEFIEELKKKREWDDTNPTLLREYRNKWVLDVQSLWVRYNELINNYDTLPSHKWNYILGIDIGFKDADALAVLAWCEADPVTYLVEERITAKQGLTELVDQVQALRSKYDFSKMVIDEGGLGKKLAEEMRRRHHIPVHPADKQRKQETVEFFNDALRTSRFKAKKDTRFVQDSYLVQVDWDKSTPNRIVVKKNPHSDIIDSVLYAFKESPAYTYQAAPIKPTQGTPEWNTAEQDAMFEQAKEYFEAQAEMLRDPYKIDN